LTRTTHPRWTVLATALMTLFALVMPLAGGAQAADNDFVLDIPREQETATVHTGTVHQLTPTIPATCTEADGCQIDLEIESGPSDPDNTPLSPDAGCTVTQGTSTCGTSVTSTTTGRQIIRAWVDDDNDNATFDADKTEKARVIQGEPGERLEPDDTDVVTVTWATTGDPASVTATPAAVTQKYGQPRTISCHVLDGFDDPVANASCDAKVTDGPNSDETFGGSAVPGYVGDCTTGPAGEACNITYTSRETGTDFVKVFADQDGDDNDDGGSNRDPFAIITSDWTSDIKSGPCAGLNYSDRRAKQGGGAIIAGSPGADTIAGTRGPDTVCALAGNDKVDGNGGNDHVLAGLGFDNVTGEGGDDNLDGNEGRDTLAGGDGVDTIVAGGHIDKLYGGAGNDIVKGQDGTDALFGKGGADTLEGGTDADVINAGIGNDTLKGGGGNDRLDGNLGTDTCRPGPGRDQVRRCEQ
jgi:Ca2+-binding RTX toxin-like protein